MIGRKWQQEFEKKLLSHWIQIVSPTLREQVCAPFGDRGLQPGFEYQGILFSRQTERVKQNTTVPEKFDKSLP